MAPLSPRVLLSPVLLRLKNTGSGGAGHGVRTPYNEEWLVAS